MHFPRCSRVGRYPTTRRQYPLALSPTFCYHWSTHHHHHYHWWRSPLPVGQKRSRSWTGCCCFHRCSHCQTVIPTWSCCSHRTSLPWNIEWRADGGDDDLDDDDGCDPVRTLRKHRAAVVRMTSRRPRPLHCSSPTEDSQFPAPKEAGTAPDFPVILLIVCQSSRTEKRCIFL